VRKKTGKRNGKKRKKTGRKRAINEMIKGVSN